MLNHHLDPPENREAQRLADECDSAGIEACHFLLMACKTASVMGDEIAGDMEIKPADRGDEGRAAAVVQLKLDILTWPDAATAISDLADGLERVVKQLRRRA